MVVINRELLLFPFCLSTSTSQRLSIGQLISYAMPSHPATPLVTMTLHICWITHELMIEDGIRYAPAITKSDSDDERI